MKRWPRLLHIPVVLLVWACNDPSDPAEQQPREPLRNLTAQEGRLADASIGFGLRLYQQVASVEDKPNVLVSPLSASLALGMTLNGAEDETERAMRSTLGFGTLTQAEVNEAYKGLIAQLLARDTGIFFTIANSVWHERRFTVKQPFIDAARSYFDAEVEALDFMNPDAPKTISGWAERKTGGRIKDLIKQIAPEEVMFLVNAVYFKAPWTTPFDERSTRNGAFRKSDGSTVDVPLMTRDGSFLWTQNSELVAVDLLYADSAFSMLVIAPTGDTPLSALESRLGTNWWSQVAAALRPGRVMLTLPKFRFEYGKQLNDPLDHMGMGIAFDPFRANFDRIADRDDIYISRVEQKTFIDVNESGTEAAAATTVGIGVTSLPPSVTFDRPFLFAIRERESGALLFVGRVGDPAAR